MNDFAVAGRYALTKAASGLQYNHLMPDSGQGAGNGKPNDTGADYNGLRFEIFFWHLRSTSPNCRP